MKVFYAVRLTHRKLTRQRFQLYELVKPRPGTVEADGDGLNAHALLDTACWPEIVDGDVGKPNPRTKHRLLPYQRRSEPDAGWPAWHFVLEDGNELHDLAAVLAGHFKTDVDVRELHGMRPSNYFGEKP